MAEGWVTQTAPLRVQLAGDETDSPAQSLASYTAAENDKVEVANFGGRLLVRGKAST